LVCSPYSSNYSRPRDIVTVEYIVLIVKTYR
jgi:hypothetical protein